MDDEELTIMSETLARQVVEIAALRALNTEMLEALNAAQNAMSYDLSQSTDEYERALRAVNAAIAKAEGQP